MPFADPTIFRPRTGATRHAPRGHAARGHAVRGHALRGRASRGHALRGHAARGIALLQVMCAVAVAVVLSLAVLSGSVLQVQSTANRAGGMQADALADSGLNLALYYIENPAAAPVRNADGYWPGEANVSFGPNVQGATDVTVARTANTATAATYSVVATGRAGTNLTHTAKAVIRYNKGYAFAHAVGFNASATIDTPFEVNGNVQCRGTLTVPLLHVVKGTVYAVNTNYVLGTVLGGAVRISPSAVNIPNSYSINTYKTYTYNGQTYRAAEITGNTLGGGGGVTLGPTADNPAGVYFYSCNSSAKSPTFTLNGNVTMNGTLVIDNATLQVNGPNNVITAQRGFPALVASNDLVVFGGTTGLLGVGGTGNDVSLRGIAWLGGSIKTDPNAANAAVYVNGALLFGNTGGVDNGFKGKVVATYDASRAYAPDLDAKNPSGTQIISWAR